MLLPLLLSLHKSFPTRGASAEIAVKYWICMPILGAIMRFSVLIFTRKGALVLIFMPFACLDNT